jgi:hypothetical protein
MLETTSYAIEKAKNVPQNILLKKYIATEISMLLNPEEASLDVINLIKMKMDGCTAVLYEEARMFKPFRFLKMKDDRFFRTFQYQFREMPFRVRVSDFFIVFDAAFEYDPKFKTKSCIS